MRGRSLRYALAAMGVAGIVALVVLGVSRPAPTGPVAATTATATPTETPIPIVLCTRTPVPVGTPETADTATTTAPILTLGQTVGAGTYRIVGADKPGVVFTVPAGIRITYSRIEVSLCLGCCGGDAIILTNFANDQEWLCILSISLEECGRNVLPSGGSGDGISGQQGDNDSGGTGAMFDAIIDSARPGP